MEIIDYLRRNKRTATVLVGVPLLGVVAASAYAVSRPTSYVGRTIVAAPALVGGTPGQQFSGAQATSSFVNAFISSASTPAVINQVVAETGTPYGTVSNGMSISQSGASSVLTVSFTSHRQAKAGPVAEAIARDTLNFMFASQTALAQQSLAAVTATYDAQRKQATALKAHTNGVAPDQAAGSLAQQINSLQQQQAQQQAAGNTTAAASLGSAIAVKQQQLTALAPTVNAYLRLSDQLSNTVASMQSVQQEVTTARQQQAAADPAKVLYVRKTHKAPRIGPTLRIALPAAGIGLFLAAGLVLLMESIGRRTDPVPAVPAHRLSTDLDRRSARTSEDDLDEPGFATSVPANRANGRPL